MFIAIALQLFIISLLAAPAHAITWEMASNANGFMGVPASVTITLTYGNGAHPTNGYVTITSISNGGTTPTMSGPTDANGEFTTPITWEMPGPTTVTYNVKWDEGGHSEGITRNGPTIAQETLEYYVAADGNSYNVNEGVSMYVLCKYQPTGHRVQGAGVTVTATGPAGATVSPGSGTTDSDGKFSFTYRSPTVGQAQVSSTVSLQYANGITCSVNHKTENDNMPGIVATPVPEPPSPYNVNVKTASSEVNVGLTTGLTVTVKDATNKPVSGATVALEVSGPGADYRLGQNSGTTDASGVFSTSLKSSITPGDYVINAVVSYSGNYKGTGSTNLKVAAASASGSGGGSGQPQNTPTAVVPPGPTATATPTPTEAAVLTQGTPTPVATPVAAEPLGALISLVSRYLVPILAALFVLLLLSAIFAFLWFRTRLVVNPRKASLPCDGVSTVPVRVMLVNMFGLPRVSKFDREVEMETTSGSLPNVVIPAMKQYADVALKASNECGQVTVTGRFGKKTTSAQLSFTSENGEIELVPSPAAVPADGTSTASLSIRFKDGSGHYFSSLQEKVIDLSTTLGSVPTQVRIAPRASSGSAVLMAGENAGEAVVTAASGSMRGECKVAFKGTPKRYCMHCGVPMSMEAASCPKCGKVPPSGVDTSSCGNCESVIPESARFCYKCGAKQPEQK